jgi:hypothetical protein
MSRPPQPESEKVVPYVPANIYGGHRWALSLISVISDIGLSLISERPISD